MLGYSDSNQEKQDQNLLCYHYTIAQTYIYDAFSVKTFVCSDVGLLGLEPRKTGPESVVLPLHHSPKSENDCHLFVLTVQRYNIFGTYKAFRHFFLPKNIFFFFFQLLSSKNFRIYRKPSIFVLCYI